MPQVDARCNRSAARHRRTGVGSFLRRAAAKFSRVRIPNQGASWAPRRRTSRAYGRGRRRPTTRLPGDSAATPLPTRRGGRGDEPRDRYGGGVPGKPGTQWGRLFAGPRGGPARRATHVNRTHRTHHTSFLIDSPRCPSRRRAESRKNAGRIRSGISHSKTAPAGSPRSARAKTTSGHCDPPANLEKH